jgi:putative Holliday junction resolvase
MMSNAASSSGRIVGVDYGSRRIGLAITDPQGKLASPLTIYNRRTAVADATFFQQLVQQEDVAGFVVGLPLHMSGQESQKSHEARQFGDWLASVTGVRVMYFDERYSSRTADEVMAIGRLTSKQRRRRRDMLAAQIMLQQYLDSPEARQSGDEGARPM